MIILIIFYNFNYQSISVLACILVYVCVCIGNETPLTPIQILLVNLIMNSLGSLALATKLYEELLQRLLKEEMNQ